MGKRNVYAVFCGGDEHQLTVSVDGKSVPMNKFVETYTPIQVTGLTHLSPGTPSQNFIGLIIAEGTEKKEAQTAWGS